MFPQYRCSTIILKEENNRANKTMREDLEEVQNLLFMNLFLLMKMKMMMNKIKTSIHWDYMKNDLSLTKWLMILY